MPVGKTIAECLQGLGVLEKTFETQSKTQWPQSAKSLNGILVEFSMSIEEEIQTVEAGEILHHWVKDRATGWVLLNGERWSAKDRSMLLPHAPVYPRDKPIIIYWVQQYILNKWDNAIRNRKKKEAFTSLPGLRPYDTTTAQIPNNERHVTSMQDIKEAQATKETHDPDEWDPYHDSESNTSPPNSAAASVPNQSFVLPQSISHAVVPYSGPGSQASQANYPSQEPSSSTPASNNFRSRTYALVSFQAEMYSRVVFLISPSANRDGHMNRAYARIMGLEEAQKAETFRAGVLERLVEMGEVVGSRKLVAKPEWLLTPFMVEDDHDHHFLLEALKTWIKFQSPGLCVVYVSLEDEV